MREAFEQEIVAAAGEAFAAHGLEGFSLRKLALRLRCSPGTLYLYFKNKEDLLHAVVERAFEKLLEAIRSQPKTGNVFADLRQWFLAYVRFGLRFPNEYRCAFVLPSISRTKPYRPHAAFEVLRSYLQVGMANGTFRKSDVDRTAQVLWAGVHGLTSLFIARPGFPWVKRESLVDALAQSLIEGLLAPNGKTSAKSRRSTSRSTRASK